MTYPELLTEIFADIDHLSYIEAEQILKQSDIWPDIEDALSAEELNELRNILYQEEVLDYEPEHI